MSGDYSFIYSEQFRDQIARLNRQISNTPQMRRAAEIALEATRANRYQSVVSAYFKNIAPEVSRSILSALAKTRSGPSQAVAERLVEYLRTNPPAVPRLPAIPTSKLTALSQMVVERTAVGSQYDSATIQRLFEQVRRAQLEQDEAVPPELEGVTDDEFEAIPEEDRQTLTPQQVRLIKAVIRCLLISTFVCLYLTAQEGTDLSKAVANILAAYGLFDDRTNKIVGGVTDWADTSEENEGSTSDES